MKDADKKITGAQASIKDALIKKALGYDAKEVVEEYVESDGEIKLCKKKVTTKNVPPDVTALKLLLESDDTGVEKLSDEELLKEKDRLLLALSEIDKKEKEKKNCRRKKQ